MRLAATATFRPRGDSGQFIASFVTPGVLASVSASAELVVSEAKAIVPVDTGALRDSIGASVAEAERTVVGTVVAGMPYAAYVEYGTGQRGAASAGAGPFQYSPTWPGQAAQPYMRPALDTAREAIKELFRSQIALALKK
jgi:HK97 gp10 family phage protein